MKKNRWFYLNIALILLIIVAPIPISQLILKATTEIPGGASFDTTYRHTLQSDYKTVRQLKNDKLVDKVWRNDVLDAKIVVWTGSSELHQLKIEASDFVSNQHSIPAANADIRWINETQANIGSADPTAPVQVFPDVIHLGGSINLEAEKVKSAWISIDIPEDTVAGNYEGTFRISADELSQPLVLTLNFEVIDLIVPSVRETTTQVELWQHPYTSARYYGVSAFSEEHIAYLLPQLEEYAKMGGRGLIANIVEEAWNHQSYDSDPTMVKWTKQADGTFSFDYTDYDCWIETAIQAGILDPQNNIGQIKSYSIAPWENMVTYYDELTSTSVRVPLTPGSEDWKTAWSAFLSDYMKHTIEKGWFDITYIAMDERGMDVLEHCVDLIESITNEQGVSFKISSAMNYSSGNDYRFLDRIDDISVGLSHIHRTSQDMANLSQHRKELGLLTTIYTCTGQYPSAYTTSDMSELAWTMWYSLKQGTDGFLRWSWDGWVEDPLTDVSYRAYEPGDPWMIYPAEKDSQQDVFYQTPRYKILKQGIRDINKAKLLMELSEQVEGEVTTLVNSLQRPKSTINRYGSGTFKSKTDRNLVDSEVIRMRTGINNIAKDYLSSTNYISSIVPTQQIVSVQKGQNLECSVSVNPQEAANQALTWTSQDSEIVEVDQRGKLTGIKAGVTSIIVASIDQEQVKAVIKVIVTDPAVNRNLKKKSTRPFRLPS